MARQPLQVIVIPFRKSENVGYQFAVFHRADDSMWQFIAGGAKDDETAEQTARREAEEEAGISKGARFFRFKEATRLLTWESNRIALWELNERLNTDIR